MEFISVSWAIKTLAIENLDTLAIQDDRGWWRETFTSPIQRVACLPGGRVAVLTSLDGRDTDSHLFLCARDGKKEVRIPRSKDCFSWIDYRDGAMYGYTVEGFRCRIDWQTMEVTLLEWTK